MKHKLRPAPERLKLMRIGATHRWLARFYGVYESVTGKMGRFSFQVYISPKLSQNRKALAECIRMTVEALREGYVPEHEPGETFHSFEDLNLVRWFRVRRLRDYEAGVAYGR